MQTIDDIVRGFTLKDIQDMRIDIETLIEKLNTKEAILVDVRMPLETALWGVKFALEIPYSKLPDSLDKLPKDKLIVCACPNEYRSNMAKEYLRFKGYNVASLDGGLTALVQRLRGGKAKDLKI